MKSTLHLAALFFTAAAFSCANAARAQTVMPLWPHGTPEPAQSHEPEKDLQAGKNAIPGHQQNIQLTNISEPTLTLYQPPATVPNTGAAALVFPGGGYRFLNMRNAGTEPCEWLNSIGITCILVKYRVPQVGYYPENRTPFEDAQQAARITRAHAAEWHIDPKRIGAMGFSAGGNLAIVLSTHPDDKHVEATPAARDIPMEARKPGTPGTPIDARLDFAIVCWPAFVTVKPEETALSPTVKPNAFTPTTFLIQAENDPMFHPNALVYYRGLMDAKIPAELHYYATGGHAFGIHPPAALSQQRWLDLLLNWLRFSKIIPPATPSPAPVEGR